jgi:hypothetical protein
MIQPRARSFGMRTDGEMTGRRGLGNLEHSYTGHPRPSKCGQDGWLLKIMSMAAAVGSALGDGRLPAARGLCRQLIGCAEIRRPGGGLRCRGR